MQSLRDFRRQLNYVHLQDYALHPHGVKMVSMIPLGVMSGEYANVDFPSVRQALEETNYDRWVTSVPGVPIVTPLEEAKRSKATVALLERNWLLNTVLIIFVLREQYVQIYQPHSFSN